MVVTVQQLLTDMLSLVGAVAMDEAPTASELQLALRQVNYMLDHWSASAIMLRSSTRDSFVLTPGKTSYNIGPSGTDFVTAQILTIETAVLQDATKVDYPLSLIDQTEYDSYDDRDIVTGVPLALFYDAGATQTTANNGTLYFYPTPSLAYTLILESDKYLSEFVNLTDTVTFAPVYYEALLYNGALRLFRHFHSVGTAVPPDIAALAGGAVRTLHALNRRQYRLALDYPGKSGQGNYNILSDTVM